MVWVKPYTWGHSSQSTQKICVSSFCICCILYRFVARVGAAALDERHVVNPCIPKLCIFRNNSMNLKEEVISKLISFSNILTKIRTFCYLGNSNHVIETEHKTHLLNFRFCTGFICGIPKLNLMKTQWEQQNYKLTIIGTHESEKDLN